MFQLSGSRMKVAGRFKPCLHMGCFDLDVFVEMNQCSRKASLFTLFKTLLSCFGYWLYLSKLSSVCHCSGNVQFV